MGQVSIDESESEMSQCFKRWSGRRVVIADATNRIDTTPSTQRRMQAEWMRVNKDTFSAYTISCALPEALALARKALLESDAA